jgi:hypothetical protein
MGSTKYTVGDSTVSFSVKRVRADYPGRKEAFFKDMAGAFRDTDGAKLKQVLERVWNEAFPQGKGTDGGEGAE